MKKFNNSINNGKIKVRISNKKGNSNMDGTPRTIKKVLKKKKKKLMIQKLKK